MVIDKNQPILFIDMGYMCFYRFNASKTWYRLSHPEEMKENPKPNWIEIEEFVTKYENIFFKTINDLVNKLRIPWSNVILCKDCSRKTIWRNEIYSEYKSTREQSHIKSGFDGHEIFKYTHNHIIPKYQKLYNFKYISSENAEADDIIAICAIHFSEKYNSNIHILTSDNDYTQLLKYSNITIIDMKMKKRVSIEPKKDLWNKILTGDKSDNIPACYIQQTVIYPEKNKRFIKCTPKITSLLFNISDWESLLNDNIKNKQHTVNQTLIDFNFIPKHIKEKVLEYFI